MLKTFKIGGVHPQANKISKDLPIERFAIPSTVVIPLSQHIGAPAVVCVAKGDKVKAGQLIAKAGGFVSSNIHSSVSGTVTAVDTYLDAQGLRKPAVTIAVEGDEWIEGVDLSPEVKRECALEPKEIVAKIADAGIVGMGGATFPTQVKLSVPAGKTAEFLIINGVECEPYLTCDHRVMLERSEELLVGAQIIAKALGVKRTFVGIENNKPDAIARLTELAVGFEAIEIVPLKMKYPQGGEKQLIDAVTGRQVPSGGLPIDVGCVVQNVGTTLAVYEAVQKNKPLVERVLTVTGKSVKQPKNLLVRIGTSVDALIDYCGGLPEGDVKVLGGGPMMGRAMSNLTSPVTKGSSGFTIIAGSEALRHQPGSCIRCGKCVEACPMGLEPNMLYKFTRLGLYDNDEQYYIYDCIECGCCLSSCPAYLPLLDYVRIGKAEVMRRMRARKQ